MNKFEQVSGFDHQMSLAGGWNGWESLRPMSLWRWVEVGGGRGGSGIQHNKYKVENKNIIRICILLQHNETYKVQTNSGIIATRNIDSLEISQLIH